MGEVFVWSVGRFLWFSGREQVLFRLRMVLLGFSYVLGFVRLMCPLEGWGKFLLLFPRNLVFPPYRMRHVRMVFPLGGRGQPYLG